MATHNLPPQSTPFIGRGEELAEIARLLTDPACRLLTLVGPGGGGKTRLAIQVAAQLMNAFNDGVHFVPLAPLSALDSIVPAIAGVLGLYFDANDTPTQQLLSNLRKRHLLLVMDNFEHLLEVVEVVAEILDAAPDVKILATSREALNLQEEWVRRVDGMRFPTSDEVENVEDFSAIRLFAERARRIRADFSLKDEQEGVVRICRLVQGMPLGVELAAAWLKTLPCAHIADEIQRNLDFLASPLRNVPERHRSMRAVFDHSWKLLTPEEQAVFRTLAVFRGGFEREAAQNVANASLSTLSALANKSLLQWTVSGRYDLHELLRQYAEQQLEASGESPAAHAAHSAYYMDFLAQRDEDVKGRRQLAALREIRTDFENIRVAWRWAQDQHQYTAMSRAVNCLLNFADLSLRFPDVLSILQQTAAAFASSSDESTSPIWEQVAVRCEWAKHHLLGRVDNALVETILQRARERGDLEEVVWSLWVLVDYASLSDPARGVEIAEEALALRRALGDEFYIAHALVGLSMAYYLVGQLERGLDCLHESVGIRRRIGDTNGFCISLAGLGLGSLLLGSLIEAETYLDQAITLQEEIGKTPFYVFLMAWKAALAFWRGEVELASRLVQTGLNFAPDQDYLSSKSISLAVLSFTVSIGGHYTHGRELCGQAAVNPHTTVFMLSDWGLALASCGQDDDSSAGRSLQTCLRRAVSRRWPTFQRLCLPLAAVLSARHGDPQRAVELLGLTSAAPPNLMGWLEKWPLMIELRSELEAELGPEDYAAAWERGAVLQLETVATQLLDNAQTVQPERTQNGSQSLVEPVSERELEVLRLIADGLSNAEIAQKLFLTVGTVKVHTRNIYGKLGVSSRTQAVVQAQKLKLL